MGEAKPSHYLQMLQWLAPEARRQLGSVLRALEDTLDAERDGQPAEPLEPALLELANLSRVLAVAAADSSLARLATEVASTCDFLASNEQQPRAIAVLGSSVLILARLLDNAGEHESTELVRNDLRAVREAPLASEEVPAGEVIRAGLERLNPAVGSGPALAGDTLQKLAATVRQAATAISRGEQSEESLFELRKAFSLLADKGGRGDLRAVGYAGLALFGLEPGQNEQLPYALVRQLDRVADLLQNPGPKAVGLVQNLLAYVPLAKPGRERNKLTELFQLRGPDDAGTSGTVSHTADADSAQQAAAALAQDLAQLQDSLEQFFLSGDLSQALPPTQQSQAEQTIDRVNATLQLLDLQDALKSGESVRRAIDRLAALETRKEDRESIYLELAEALIQLGGQLDAWATRSSGEGASGSGLEAARRGLASQARQGLLQQISRLEELSASNDAGAGEQAGTELAQIAAVLRYVPLEDLAAAIEAVASRLMRQAQLEPKEWDQVAEVLMAADYYLENLTAEMPVRIDLLQQQALAAAAKLAPELVVRAEADSAGQVRVPAAASPPSAAAGSSGSGPQEIELDELVDIFLEEAAEVQQASEEALARWRSGDAEGLVELRRGFHTLKGGGRMVGATALGEFSWAVENLLNRVIEKTVAENPGIVEVAARAVDEVSKLVSLLRQANVGESENSAELRELCNRLARGEQVDLAPVAGTQAAVADDEAVALPETESGATSPESAAGEAGADSVADVPGTELFATFLAEAGQLLGVMRDCLDGAEQNSGAKLQALSMSLHNLASSMRAAGLSQLEAATEPVEKWVNLSVSRRSALEQDALPALREWAGALNEALRALESKGTPAIEEAVRALLALSAPFEKRLANRPTETGSAVADDRRRRFSGMRRLMTDGLDVLLAPAWRIPQRSSLLEKTFVDDLLRDLGEIRSISHSSNLAEIELLAEHLRALVAHLARDPEQASEREFLLLQTAREELLRALDAIASGQVIPAPAEEVLEGLASYRDQIATDAEAPSAPFEETEFPVEEPELQGREAEEPEPATESEDGFAIPELMQVFLAEAEELVARIGEQLAAWREAPGQLEHANELHRALHTLKGGARVAGLSALGTLSHEFESLIIDHQVADRADADFFERAFALYDQLSARIESVPSTEPEAAVDMPASAAPVPAQEAPLDAGVQTLVSIHRPGQERTFTVAPTFESGLQKQFADNRADGRGGEEIRVNTDLLDKLVNLSGESITVRGRLESRLNELEFNLEELESTIGRVKSLVRRLDSETEAQIEFRREQIAESEELKEFDPLEMDRYSQLQQLSRQLQESISDLNDLRLSMGRGSRDFSSLLMHSGRLNSEINEGLVRSRMVRFARIVPRLERISRQVSVELGKQVELKVLNVDGDVDRKILDQILAPLEHMLRNAIDHGIEPAAERRRIGKPERGTIYLSVSREGGYMVVRVADDGRGLDPGKIRQHALERNLLDAEQADALTDQELYRFIFESGFSTAEALTEISGRGVGMDVVHDVVRRLGGRVDVDSRVGEGTVIRLNLPFTLSVNRTLSVRCGHENFAVPLVALEALVRLPIRDLKVHYANPAQKFHYADADFDFVYLGDMLGVSAPPDLDDLDVPSLPLILFQTAGRRVAVLVDEIIGTQELVVKSLGTHFKDVRGLSGAAIVNDGRVVITLDINRLVEVWSESGETGGARVTETQSAPVSAPTIMVVDDSVTVRKFTDRFLTRAGFEVLTARDGVEALRTLHDQRPDLILLDVEMPRMDGFELLGILRSTTEFADLPVILITSRTGEKHRERGLALGAQGYFGKPYREPDLLAAIANLIDVGPAGTTVSSEGDEERS